MRRADLSLVLQEFFRNGKIPRGGNSSFIVLIPKTNDATSLNDFRPISLISSLYKIVAKILAGRISEVIASIISESQSAFVRDRFILDGVVILNEVISEAKKTGEGRLIFKIDFAKAFDSVEWDFVDVMLQQFNFAPTWRKWIRGCLSSASANVLVNGSPSGEFDLERGLRQGDPLSPFLFLIVAEGLHALIEGATVRGLIQPAEFMSGLAVNFNKSSLMGVGVEEAQLERLALDLNCKVGSFPFKYLGIKVGGRLKSVVDWSYIVEKVRKKIDGWKNRKLSLAGRVTLVKAWVWRYLAGSETLWARVMRSIYGEIQWGADGLSLKGGGRSRGGWWPMVVSKGRESWFLDNIERRVGDGSNTKFWTDKWAGKTPLKFVFPRLFYLCEDKEASIKEAGKWVNGEWVWEVKWRRDLFDRESVAVNNLFAAIADVKICAGGGVDRWTWRAAKEGAFTTRTAYLLIKNARSVDGPTIANKDLLANVWSPPAAFKTKVFSWRALRRRLPTCANLIKKNVPLEIVETSCNACFHPSETEDHVLLQCPKAQAVWDRIQNWLGCQSARHHDITVHFNSFSFLGKGKKIRNLLKALWMCTCWSIWKQRNSSRFEGKVQSVDSLVSEVKARCWTWFCVFKIVGFVCNFEEWCSPGLLAKLM
ncbi:uncharacterized protein LOC131007831 [Salvia miltiorrhiza]|uniref:uncharacterized protein LOC131007831 n=1 Tax=Salvia miltiorrhiza TaxID=226208 RepID=UPI0025ACE256|nr:uncharacterized protein LOC131007831 [Salvia miltiorrhiza]